MKISTHLKNSPTITMNDPLSQILGAIDDGLIEYSYLDCVKVAGHSCPTVASSFAMTKFALKELYQDETPIRGNIRVLIKDAKEKGVTGVIGGVCSFITGACDEGGFKGLGGNFSRDNKLSYDNNDINGPIRFERIDTGAGIDVDINLDELPSNPRVGELIGKVIQGNASKEEQAEFCDHWQSRVRALLDGGDKLVFSL